MANKACSDERFTKDKVWSSRELLLGIEAQATVSNAISMMIDTSKRNAKHATISLELCNTSFCSRTSILIMTQAHLKDKSLVSWREHTTRPTTLDIRAAPFLSGINPMTNSQNCTCQQSLANRRDQCVHTKVPMQSLLAGM